MSVKTKNLERQFYRVNWRWNDPQGDIGEKLRAGGAGIPAFLPRTGVGTQIVEGKEEREFVGRQYIPERSLVADVAIGQSKKADKAGNFNVQ